MNLYSYTTFVIQHLTGGGWLDALDPSTDDGGAEYLSLEEARARLAHVIHSEREARIVERLTVSVDNTVS